VYTNDRIAEASLTGEGTSPMLQLSQPSLDFGDVRVSTSSAPRTLRLTNTGSGPLTVTALRVTGADASTFLHTVPSLPHTLQPQGSLDVPVVFTPNAERSFSAQFVVESDDPRMPAVSVPMTGSGVPVRVTVSAASLDFGNQLIHRASAPRTVRVTNGSDGNVTLTALSLESGSSQFSLALMEVPVVLAPGQHQDVTVTFTPRTEAGVAAVLKLTFAELPRPLEVSLRGTGILTVLSIQPSPLSFGTVRTGSPKQELPLTLTNVSNEPIVLAAPQVKSRTGEPFTYDAASVQGRTINPGGTLIVQVGYQPVNETLSETTLTFGTTTPPLPQAAEARLTGRATGSFVSVDTERVDFGLVDLGAPVEPKTVTLTNRSDQPRQVVAKLRDVEGSPYTLQTSALANPIPAGGTATLTVSFAPTKAGPAENELQVFLQGESAAEVTVPVVGEVRSRGCGCGTTDAGSAGVMALLTLLGLGLRRRRA
jgi:MYXO-CTERM domain-containing protein